MAPTKKNSSSSSQTSIEIVDGKAIFTKKKKDANKKAKTLYLSTDVTKLLDKLVKETGTSTSDIVETALKLLQNNMEINTDK